MPYQQIVTFAYAGYRGEESPRAFILDGKRIEVLKIVARWIEEDLVANGRFRLFWVEGDDCRNHLLRYDETTGDWLYSGGKANE
jgi:hypothetical protein